MNRDEFIQELNIERSRYLDKVKALNDLIELYQSSPHKIILHEHYYYRWDRLKFIGPDKGKPKFTIGDTYEIEEIKLDPILQDYVVYIYDDRGEKRRYVAKEVRKRFKKINQHKITRYDN